jgi:hypothetical protein
MLALRDSAESWIDASDSGVYTTSNPALELGKSLSVSSDSGAIKIVAHRSWHLHVGPLVVTTIVSLSESGISRTQVVSQLAAGSSSLVFTTNGKSFEDVKPIDGRYGYVTISPYFEFPRSKFVPLIGLLDCTLVHHHGRNSYLDQLQPYAPIVLPRTCPILQIMFLRVLTGHDPKAWVYTTWVSILLASATSYEYERLFLLISCPQSFSFLSMNSGLLLLALRMSVSAPLSDSYAPNVYAYGAL